jgi:BirA family transcriptional regulator, biotin operon repressor / biotin---[acetyl-CoA-carboxylase] ligase
MKLPDQPFVWIDEIESTQDLVSKHVREGDRSVQICLAGTQWNGRGRHGRHWLDEPGSSLLASIAFHEYAGHKEPWLIGMTAALAVASAFHTQVRWPNDVTIGGLKVGGILTELVTNPQGEAVPVVGIGINLRQTVLDESIRSTATSIKAALGVDWTPAGAWFTLSEALRSVPEPDSWQSIKQVWDLFDDTPRKKYRMLDGVEVTALGVGPIGQLIASREGETVAIMAAEAIFGKHQVA